MIDRKSELLYVSFQLKGYYCSSVTAHYNEGECDPKGLRRTTFAHSKHRTLVLVLFSSGGQSCRCCSFDHDDCEPRSVLTYESTYASVGLHADNFIE